MANGILPESSVMKQREPAHPTDDEYAKIAARIVQLPPEQWIEEACRVALNGEDGLKYQIMVAVESAVARKDLLVSALDSAGDLDLDTDHQIFKLFRSKRVAELFKEHPHMHGVLTTRARTQSYNVGAQELVKLYDTIAEDPDSIIEKCAKLLYWDTNVGIMENPEHPSLGEHWAAMEYLVEKHSKAIRNLYSEYRTVPRKSDVVDIEERSSRSRSRSAVSPEKTTTSLSKDQMVIASALKTEISQKVPLSTIRSASLKPVTRKFARKVSFPIETSLVHRSASSRSSSDSKITAPTQQPLLPMRKRARRATKAF